MLQFYFAQGEVLANFSFVEGGENYSSYWNNWKGDRINLIHRWLDKIHFILEYKFCTETEK